MAFVLAGKFHYLFLSFILVVREKKFMMTGVSKWIEVVVSWCGVNVLAGKFLSCGGLLGSISIMAGSGEEERLPRTRHYICSDV